MNLAYVVRCNFNDPGKEEGWNAWYSGPKLPQMLAKPYFLTGQRFKRVAGDGRDYLAFWTLSSAEAFETPDYKNDWGFFEWRPYIIDWSRDLFAREDESDVIAPRLGEGEYLRLVSFEGASEEEANALRAKVDAARPGAVWHKPVGLDRHTELFGVSIEKTTAQGEKIPGVFEAFYAPISDLAVTGRDEFKGLIR